MFILCCKIPSRLPTYSSTSEPGLSTSLRMFIYFLTRSTLSSMCFLWETNSASSCYRIELTSFSCSSHRPSRSTLPVSSTNICASSFSGSYFVIFYMLLVVLCIMFCMAIMFLPNLPLLTSPPLLFILWWTGWGGKNDHFWISGFYPPLFFLI